MQIKPYVLLHLELFRSVFLWLTCVGCLMTNSVVEQILYIYLVGVLNRVSVLQDVRLTCMKPL